jgi:hypothetical protein
LLLVGCEDGPAQTFQPATGTLWNNGSTPFVVSDAGQSFVVTSGGTNATQICSGDELQRQWGEMIGQPIAPARFVAGLDLDNGPTFPLLKVEQAETGPTFPVQFACVSNPVPKGPQDGFYGFVPGATESATDPCVANQTQTDCVNAANKQLGSSSQVCGWNVVQATAPYLAQGKTPSKLCQATVVGPGPDGATIGGSILVGWGNNDEVEMEWAIPTHKAYYMQLNNGYNGLLQWDYLTPNTPGALPPGDGKVHAYSWQIGRTILKDGESYKIDWSTPANYEAELDEIYRGIASTYAPDIYDDAPPGITCTTTGTCLAYSNAEDGTGRALFGMRPVSFYMYFDPPTLPDPSGFTVQSSYLFNIKYAPYSGIHSYFKMYDPSDPSKAQPYGDGLVGSLSPQKHCHFGMGDTFQNLLDNCIDVFPQAAQGQADLNVAAQNKVLGDLSHDDQNFTFAVVGINQNFRPVKLDVCLGPMPAAGQAGAACGTDTQDIIHDDDSPLDDPLNSVSNNFDSDVRSFGAIINDSYPDPAGGSNPDYIHDWHGSGAVWREYGRIVQAQMSQAYATANQTAPRTLHDPTCYFPEQCSDGVSTSPGACFAASPPGTWAVGSLMTMSPPTACSTSSGNAPCIAVNPKAVCNTAEPGSARSLGLVANTCVVPFDVNSWRPAPGCTGFESLVTNAEAAPPNVPEPVYTSAADDLWDIGYTATPSPYLVSNGFSPFANGAGEFKPGEPYALFCNDPGSYVFCGQNGDIQGLNKDLLDASATRLLQYLGHGNVLSLPPEGRDLRYFFQTWSIAYAKYLTSPAVLGWGTLSGMPAAGSTAASNPNCAPTMPPTNPPSGCGVPVAPFANQFLDVDNFIFDSLGGGASRSEYVDFDFADSSHDPVDVEHQAIIIGFNLQSTNFYRKLDREERALFNVLATDKTQASWGYLKDASGNAIVDVYPAVDPITGASVSCAAHGNTDCTSRSTNWSCSVPAGGAGATCNASFPRHNANPFLTNLAGSALLANAGWVTQTNAKGNRIPATVTANGKTQPWLDPCNPISAPPVSCAADTDCPGIMACNAGSCVAAETAYFCATQPPGTCKQGLAPPINTTTRELLVRENGKPLLEGYCGAFQVNPFSLSTNAVTPTPALPNFVSNLSGTAAGIEIVKTLPDEGEALVSLPTFSNPYAPDATTNTNPTLVMVPWLPFQDGVGYPVSTSGSEDVFVETAQLDFTGQVVTPTMDFLPVPFQTDPNPMNPTPPYGISVKAWETQDFLGEVFVCLDGVTGANHPGIPGDILSAHMYSSAETIVDWISSHPGAQDACGIIVRYSPYDNYPDFISSLTNGVRLDIEQGAGFGRVTDATIFAPGSGALAPP